ncbi:MAG: hypothetical protein RL204_965 [Bacteroidota bacterium]|jgi:uncharacterized protein involved in exopolysaccharide biosynthesis
MKPIPQIRQLRPFLRGLPIIVVVIVIGVMAAKRYLNYAIPMYETTAKLKLADLNSGVPSSNLFKDFDVFANSSKIGSEVEMIKSSLVVQKALDSLDFEIDYYRVGKMRKIELYEETPIKVAAEIINHEAKDLPFTLIIKDRNSFTLTTPKGESLDGVFDEVYQTKVGKIILFKNKELLEQRPDMTFMGHYEFVVHSKDKLLETVVKNIDVTPIDKDIPVLRISYKSEVPKKTSDLVNMLCKVYIQDYIESRYVAANTTVNFLDGQLAELNQQLSSSENAIEDYRNENNIVNINQEAETDLKKIAEMKIQLVSISQRMASMDSLYDYIQKGKDNFTELAPNFEAFTDMLSTEIVKKMQNLQSEKKDLLLRFTPNDEKVKIIDEKLEDLKDYLIESIANTRSYLKVSKDELERNIAMSEEVFIGLPGREKDMKILTRNFNLNEQVYNFLHEKRTEAEIARAASISFHRVLEPAETPLRPISPQKSLIVALAFIVSLLGSVILIYAVHLLKGRVNDTYNIESRSTIPIAIQIPRVGGKKILERETMLNMVLQLELKSLMPQNGLLVLSSFSKKEGKHYAAANFKKILESQDRKVLLLGIDGRFPENTEFKNIEDLKFLFAKGADKGFDQIVDWKREYDHIIIANDEVNSNPFAIAAMQHADVNLFVLDSRRTPASVVANVELIRDEFNLPNMHFVLNRAGYQPSIILKTWNVIKVIISRKITLKKLQEAIS